MQGRPLLQEEFFTVGAELNAGALSNHELALLEQLSKDQQSGTPGARLTNNDALTELVEEQGSLTTIAQGKLGKKARPVRAILFDKSASANWALGWHQDRTIAVRERVDIEDGFKTWTKKSGITHVEPPFRYIERMVTLRAHLDLVDEKNAPLLFAPGSHLVGRIPMRKVAGIAGQLGCVSCMADPGDVWVYATGIVHASDAARQPRRRRVLQIDYSAEDLPGELEWLGL